MDYGKKKHSDNPHGRPMGLTIVLGGPSPERSKARKKVAKGKVKQKLSNMYDSWKPPRGNKLAVEYDGELKSLIDSIGDE
tara:strand:- start:617 stop:856 length:240 start_codon:yes stop_codon:yes gene_type:complete